MLARKRDTRSLCYLLLWTAIFLAHAQANDTPQERAQKLTAKAVESFNQGQLKGAENGLLQSLRVSEPIYETHFWLGRIYATKSGSSPTARERAIAHFRRALEIQPYGEDGDLTRGWLLRLNGRPKSVRFVAANWGAQTNADATRRLIERLKETATQSGYEVIEAPRHAFDMSKLESADLSRECLGTNGAVQSGWMVCVGVEAFEVKWFDGKGKRGKGGYRGSGQVRAQVFDPLGKTLYKPVKLSETSLDLLSIIFAPRSANSEEASQETVASLSGRVWDRCRVIIDVNPNAEVLDETTFPSRLRGVYGRATVPYAQAVELPLLALPACGTTGEASGEEASDAARTLSSGLQSELLKNGALAVISPGGVRSALKATGAAADSTDVAELCAAARQAGARYALVWNLTQFDVEVKEIVILTKVTARVTLNLTLFDVETGEQKFQRTYKEGLGVKKFLGGAAVKSVVAKQGEALKLVRDAAARDVLEDVGAPTSVASLRLLEEGQFASWTPKVSRLSAARCRPKNTRPKGKAKARPTNDYLIVPGVRVGPVRLGMTRAQVHAALGRVGDSPPSRYSEYYSDMTLLYEKERVWAIEIQSPRYKTQSGLSLRSTLARIRRTYPRLRVFREDPFDMYALSYDSSVSGIGFCFEMPIPNNATENTINRVSVPASQRPATIAVHRRGRAWQGYYSSE